MGYHETVIDPALAEDMRKKGIDVARSLELLEGINSGRLGSDPPIKASSLPSPDDEAVLDARAGNPLSVGRKALAERLVALGLPPALARDAEGTDREAVLGARALEDLGWTLLPRTAYGVLTGGSATSYVDEKRNSAFDPELFERFRADFDLLARIAAGKPKGVAPAYLGASGEPGPRYLRLKQRALLLMAREARRRADASGGAAGTRRRDEYGPPLRPFHMPSVVNESAVASHIEEAREDPLTAGLIRETGLDASAFLAAAQPMVCAYTHSSEGRPRRVFDRAYGKEGNALPLPGGHGQCFSVLAGVFRALLAEGKRFAYICNVDNLGALPSPLAVGALAASGRPAAFDFSRRTPMDAKGGVLVRTEDGRLTCGDIGAAIGAGELDAMEAAGGAALFNCATGLFDLEWLVPRIDALSERLPLRLSDQDKDSGRYSQAERIAWEAIGLIDDPLIIAVEKSERFLAAKTLMETVLMSRAGPAAGGPGAGPPVPDTPRWRAAAPLGAGLSRLIAGAYGLSAKA